MKLNSVQLEMIQAYEETRKAQDNFLAILPLDSIEYEIRRKLKVRCDKQIQNFMQYSGLVAPF